MSPSTSLVSRCMRARSIRVLVSPTPLTFAERRCVLQVLEQYGSVQVFKMTPGYHSNFIAVTEKAATVNQLVAASPLSYVASEPADVSADAKKGTVKPTPRCKTDAREFNICVFPAPDYQHRFASESEPLAQSWPATYEQDRSFEATTLKQSLPRTIAARGLAHWFLHLDKDKGSNWHKTKRLQLRDWLPSKMKQSG